MTMSSNHRQHNRHRIVLILLVLVFSATAAITTTKAFGVGVTNCNNNSFRRRNTISHTIRINRAAAATGRIISTTTTNTAATNLSSCHNQYQRSLSYSRLYNNMASSSSSSESNQFYQRLESPSAERNKKVIWDVLSSKIFTNFYPDFLTTTTTNIMSSNNKQNRRIKNVLEIAAGSGVHTEYFVSNLLKQQQQQKLFVLPSPSFSFMWYPTDPTIDARESIQSYINDETNYSHLKDVVADPIELTLDSTGISDEVISLQPPFNIVHNEEKEENKNKNIDLIVCINMIHISSWDATIGLMKLANKYLREDSNSNEDENENDDNDNYDGGYLYCYGPYKVNGNAVQSNLNFDHSLKSRNSEWGVRNIEDVIQIANDFGNLELIHQIDMPSNNISLIFRRK